MVHWRKRKQRRMKYSFTILTLLTCLLGLAQVTVPSYYKQSKTFAAQLKAIVHEVGLDTTFDAGEDGKESISFAVIDLTGKKPVLGGVNADNFIYPASVYKMYVAMQVLKQ